MSTEPRPNSEPHPRLELSGLSRAFPIPGGSARQVLDDVSFSVAPGEFASVIGPSGCGKSTLFSHIAGLDSPSSGTLRVDGRDAIGRRDHSAYMPQQDLLFPWRTIIGNTALGLEVQGVPRRRARDRAREWFPRFGLAGFEDALPHELSGGMRQRAALLRTVIQERRTLLLDEPFGALDALTKRELQAWLQEVWLEHDWTALLITHDVREAILLSDRVVALTPRPATVRTVLDVDLPRPRGIDTVAAPEFVRLEQTLLEALGVDSAR